MNTIDTVKARYSQVNKALGAEPLIRPNLSDTDIAAVIAVVCWLIGHGYHEPEDIFAYLSNNGCPLSRDSVDFLLAQYEGVDREYHLWVSYSDGALYLLSGWAESAVQN